MDKQTLAMFSMPGTDCSARRGGVYCYLTTLFALLNRCFARSISMPFSKCYQFRSACSAATTAGMSSSAQREAVSSHFLPHRPSVLLRPLQSPPTTAPNPSLSIPFHPAARFRPSRTLPHPGRAPHAHIANRSARPPVRQPTKPSSGTGQYTGRKGR